MLDDLGRGQFDSLFDGGSQTPSELFRQTQSPPKGQSVELAESFPFHLLVFSLPKYPPLARAAHVSGLEVFTMAVMLDGHASAPTFLSGSPLLHAAVAAAVSDWTFLAEAAGKDMRMSIEFRMNCPPTVR